MTASRIVVAAFVGFFTVAAFGQTPPPVTAGQDPQVVRPADGPSNAPRNTGQTGSRNNQANPDANGAAQKPGDATQPQGPDVYDDPNATPEQRASAEYAGPAVLSRGISASEPMNPKNIKFTPSAGVEYLYSSGLTGVTLQNGQISDSNASGLQLNYGIIGEKVYKHDTFSLGFTGNLYHYAQQSGYDGTSNELSMTWRHRLSRHLSFGVRESLVEFNRNSLLTSGSQLVNSGLGTTLVTSSPSTEAFDGRVFSTMNEGNVTWQINSRLSLNLSGGGFFTRRASTALYGDTGYQAGADIAYRITRHVTIGSYYSYTHFDYTGVYGGSDINTVGIAYSIAFNPTTELITRIGGSRLETTGLQNFTLDPLTALVFGTTGTVQAVYLKNLVPDFNVQIRRKVSNLNLSLAYARGVTPGNGVILTSVRQSESVGVDFRARRVWSLSPTTGGYDTLTGFGVTNQRYASYFVGASVSRRLMKNVDWHSRLDFHHYTFDNTGFLRNSLMLSTGIVWTPGDLLERLW